MLPRTPRYAFIFIFFCTKLTFHQVRLQKHSLDFSHCAIINIYITDMSLFARVNSVYATFFGSSPPARACVAVDLPRDSSSRVKMDCIAYTETSPAQRSALHVQGLSYWAPANIGPYSQAIAVRAESRISLRFQPSNVYALLDTRTTCLYLWTNRTASAKPRVAFSAVPCYRDGTSVPARTPRNRSPEKQFWGRLDRAYTARAILGAEFLRLETREGWRQEYGKLHPSLSLHAFPLISALSMSYQDKGAPTLFLGVPALPKGALVEKQVVLHTGRFMVPDEDGDVEARSLDPLVTQGSISNESTTVEWTMSRFAGNESPCAIICVRGEVDEATQTEFAQQTTGLLDHTLSVRIFYRPSGDVSCTFTSICGDRQSPDIDRRYTALADPRARSCNNISPLSLCILRRQGRLGLCDMHHRSVRHR